MNETMIGKIQSVKFGMGGYDDAMLGVSFTFGSDKGWGVSHFEGTWASPPSEYAKWTLEDQTKHWGDMVRTVGDLLKQAKVSDFQKLVGKPVEVTLVNNSLKSWRLLTEAI